MTIQRKYLYATLDSYCQYFSIDDKEKAKLLMALMAGGSLRVEIELSFETMKLIFTISDRNYTWVVKSEAALLLDVIEKKG